MSSQSCIDKDFEEIDHRYNNNKIGKIAESNEESLFGDK